MTTIAKAFADTNIVLRLLNGGLPEFEPVEKLVTQVRGNGYELWISRQVIREYLVQVTRPGFRVAPLAVEQVDVHVKTLRSLFHVADENDAVTDQLLDLLKAFPSGGKQIHDANNVATMLVYSIGTLLTINVDDMKRFSSKVSIISP